MSPAHPLKQWQPNSRNHSAWLREQHGRESYRGPGLAASPTFHLSYSRRIQGGMEELWKQDGRSPNVFFFFFYSVEKKKQGARGAGWTIWMKNLQKGTWKQKYSERKQNAKSTETVVLRTLSPEILPPSWQFCSLNLCLYHAGETEWHHFTVHGSIPTSSSAILRK